MTKLCECGCGNHAPIAKYTCHERGWIKGEPIRFIHGHNTQLATKIRIYAKGAASHKWNGGKSYDPRGYVRIHSPGHPRAHKQSGYVYEHILLAEKALGKQLPEKAEVHHLNGNKGDNSPGNIVICEDRAYHMLLHKRMRNRK